MFPPLSNLISIAAFQGSPPNPALVTTLSRPSVVNYGVVSGQDVIDLKKTPVKYEMNVVNLPNNKRASDVSFELSPGQSAHFFLKPVESPSNRSYEISAGGVSLSKKDFSSQEDFTYVVITNPSGPIASNKTFVLRINPDSLKALEGDKSGSGIATTYTRVPSNSQFWSTTSQSSAPIKGVKEFLDNSSGTFTKLLERNSFLTEHETSAGRQF